MPPMPRTRTSRTIRKRRPQRRRLRGFATLGGRESRCGRAGSGRRKARCGEAGGCLRSSTYGSGCWRGAYPVRPASSSAAREYWRVEFGGTEPAGPGSGACDHACCGGTGAPWRGAAGRPSRLMNSVPSGAGPGRRGVPRSAGGSGLYRRGFGTGGGPGRYWRGGGGCPGAPPARRGGGGGCWPGGRRGGGGWLGGGVRRLGAPCRP